MCRSRRELSNAYLLAKIGVDTAENEPLEVWGENSIHYSLHSLVVTDAETRRRPFLLHPYDRVIRRLGRKRGAEPAHRTALSQRGYGNTVPIMVLRIL